MIGDKGLSSSIHFRIAQCLDTDKSCYTVSRVDTKQDDDATPAFKCNMSNFLLQKSAHDLGMGAHDLIVNRMRQRD